MSHLNAAGPGDRPTLEEGRSALSSAEWERAREIFAQIAAAEAESAEAREGLGWALYWLDEAEASFETREEAYRLYRASGRDRDAARVAIFLALDYADFRGLAVTAGWLQRARRLLEPLDEGPEHGWLHLWEGHLARAIEQDHSRARSLAIQAGETARRLGDVELEMLALALEGLIQVTEGEIDEGMRRIDEAAAAALAGEMEHIDSVVATSCFLIHACERVRDYERLSAWSDRIETFARRWRMGSIFALCETERAALLIGRGEWAEAEKLLGSSHAALEAKRPLLAPEARLQLGELRRRQGRIDEAKALFRETEPRTMALLGQAAIALDEGDPSHAAFLLERLRRRALAEKWVERAWGLELLVAASLANGSARDANDAMVQLEGISQRMGTPAIRAVSVLARALLARDRNALEEARHHLEDALDLFERCGAPWEAARVRVDLATVLHALGRSGFARQEIDAAVSAFERLGAAGEAVRARAVRDSLAKPPAQLVEARSPRLSILTRREVDVLRLVADGMSDKQVASSLKLSEHTIHRHVANILGKLDQPSRAAAVAQAARDGIL
ncbi:MAG TPA: LuxR C-terminal-related transcriptional regulator [Thermoanaerobaculia bacterium]|nr:LuxR C-terminal-related transcriptional regulator [Thermoanaerobaculia bacterium]